MTNSIRFQESVRLPVPADRLWPIAGNTDRFNRAIGLPPVSYTFEPRTGGGVRTWAKTRMYGISVEWEEKPFEWVRPFGLEVERVFRRGPVASYRFGVRLVPEGSETTAEIHADFVPRSALLGPIVRLIAAAQTKKFVEMTTALGRSARAARPIAFPVGPIRIDDRALELARAGVARRIPDQQTAILARLVDDLRSLSDPDVVGMRPFEWADARGFLRIPALEVFLQATVGGLLDMEWALICPHCRGRPSAVSILGELPEEGSCAACAARFELELDRAVEARFSVSPQVRKTTVGTYCRGGPMNTPFIWVQARARPNEDREIPVAMPLGSYRVKAGGAAVDLFVREGATSVTVGIPLASNGAEQDGGLAVSPQGTIRLTNRTTSEVTLAIEESAWESKIATAAQVAVMRTFQDLFATDVLSVEREVAVRRLVLLFSDLKGSTALYQEVGDARAYAIVRRHFLIFEEILQAREGVLVKTIGDAVMAVFTRSRDAFEAAREAHARMPPPILLRIGIHAGPLLAVALNHRNDYFGTTVNLASRLEHVADAGETIVSDDVAVELGETMPRETVHLKGIVRPVRIVRYRHKDPEPPVERSSAMFDR